MTEIKTEIKTEEQFPNMERYYIPLESMEGIYSKSDTRWTRWKIPFFDSDGREAERWKGKHPS
jgi:hypothetical protein